MGAFPDERELHAPGREFLFQEGVQAMACFAAIGESLKAVMDPRRGLALDHVSGVMDRLARHVHDGRLALTGFGQTDQSTFNLAHELRRNEPRLLPTDAIIIANMCVNESAHCLVTTDEFANWTEVTDVVGMYGKQIVGFEG